MWNKVLTTIQQKVNESSFKTWFIDSKMLSVSDDGTVQIGFPSEMVRNWVKEKYLPVVSESVREHIDGAIVVELVVSNKKIITPNTTVRKRNTLPLNEHIIHRESNLNEKYQIANFIQTPHNRFARSSAEAIVKSPGSAHNPFFVYGLTGVGKTHLLQAIGNEVRKRGDIYKVLYITAEKFKDEYLSAVSDNTIKNFKERYGSCDVLIIDDIQFLAVGPGNATREQLHHIFNDLYNKNKQIIFSSDEHPRNLEGFRQSLVSRFDFGLTIEMQPIDPESKKILVEKLVMLHSVNISDDIKNYIIEHCDPDIRAIEGKMKQIEMFASEFKKDITFEEFKSMMMQYQHKQRRLVSHKDVIREVSKFYNIPIDVVFQKTRKQKFVSARQIVMYLLREDLNLSYSEIGNKIKRDHTTVIHSCDKIKKTLEESSGRISHDIMSIRGGLYGT